MVRRIPIRAKVAGALAVPLLGVAAAAAVGVSTSAAQARDVTRQADLASASIGRVGLVSALQNERNLAMLEMLGLAGGVQLEVTDTEQARAMTDTASTTLRTVVSEQSSELRDDYAALLEMLTGLVDLRDRVDEAVADAGLAHREQAHEVFVAYTAMVAALSTPHDRPSRGVDDSAIRQGDDLLHHASNTADSVAQLTEALLFIGTGPGGVDEPAEVATLASLQRDIERNVALVDAKGTGDYAAPAQDLLDGVHAAALSDVVSQVVEQGGPFEPALVLEAMPPGSSDGYLTFRNEVVEVLDDEARRLRDDAESRRSMYLGGAVAMVGAAVFVAWAVSRSITRPLRDLSVKARQMATYRLPHAVQDILEAPPGEDLVVAEVDPLVVRARDEVADVAGAFNDVQQAAIGLAVEQAALRRNVAESYVNLGRRNQNLLSRLLKVVDDLEATESDPAQVAQLRKLSHLATRIRRNADSLLVLSDGEVAGGWQMPVDAASVVRAALREIENDERVLVRTLDPVQVVGSVASDLTHLLAELIENGLRHSPPRELVEVSGRVTPEGYAFNIVDHGLGMTAEEIERANQRLAGTESFTVTPAKYLGHYVTAVLAARHDIKVRLQGSVVVGIAAFVELPAAALATGELDGAAVAADDVPGETPTHDEVRLAVARLRSPHAVGPRPPGATGDGAARHPGLPARVELPQLPADPTVDAPVDPPEQESPAQAAPAAVGGTNGSGGGQDRPPERTASGLVRRVRGAHVPAGVAAARPIEEHGDEATAAPTGAVDAVGLQRFLTNLVGGVQRSLDEQTPATGAGDEE